MSRYQRETDDVVTVILVVAAFIGGLGFGAWLL